MNSLTLVNDPFKEINPVFYPFWMSHKTHKLAKGGRSSTKSSVISQKLVSDKMKYPDANIVALRKVANTLRKSVFTQIKWALNEAGVADQFSFTTNPMEILHKKWGTGFYFTGADDPEKLKSFKIPVGYVKDLWFEEMDAFDGETEIDTIEDSFIRDDLPDGLEVQIYGSWNPPRNPYSWINEYVDKHRNDPDFYIHHSTYLDDKRGFNSQQLLRKIQRYQENDPEYYRWMYLGEVIGLGTNVYNMNLFNKLEKLPADDPLMYLAYSIDAGHAQSATTCGCYGFTAKGNVIVLDTYYYDPSHQSIKKAPSDLSKEIHDFMKRTQRKYPVEVVKRTIDSAEAALRNQYYKDFQIQWHPIAKKKEATMIDYVQDLLAQGRVFYLDIPANQIFIEEHRQYQWDEKYIQTDDPKVIKQHDHTVDQFKYMAMDNARQLFLKF